MKLKFTIFLEKINHQLGRFRKPLAKICDKNPYQTLFDGSIDIFGTFCPFIYKKDFRLPQLSQIREQLKGGILFTDYLQPSIAETLIINKINFVDLAGNLFLEGKGTLILIQNCKKTKALITQEVHGRAFTPAGIKVLFLFLTEPKSITWDYRKISEYTHVSLGSIMYIINNLKEQKFITKFHGILRFLDYTLLIERWTNVYLEKFYNKYESERYDGKFTTPMDKFPITLTGESAAAKLEHMQTERVTLYQWGNINELIARNRWVKNSNGNIELRAAFWPKIRILKPMVPPLLIYADLLAKKDSRCTEIAQIIYNKYLKDFYHEK
ncbi:MAG: type IV toxin-antitoxin system AbiEi family antitoxin [Lentisphaeria bacterium]